MCRRVTCKRCDKPTWAGCGAHVDQVLGDVPTSERCRCRLTPPVTSATVAQPGKLRRWLSK